MLISCTKPLTGVLSVVDNEMRYCPSSMSLTCTSLLIQLAHMNQCMVVRFDHIVINVLKTQIDVYSNLSSI